jgi:Glucose / Sorbosone dehydrogenase
MGCFLFCLTLTAAAQLTHPVADPVPSGLNVRLEPWLTIPVQTDDTTSPKVRLNHLKPCPGSLRLFSSNLNGRLWVIASPAASSAADFLNLATYFPNFIRTPGLGTGLTSFAFHPEFAMPGAPGYGRFYTAHSEKKTTVAVDFSGPLSASTRQIGTLVEWTMNDAADHSITAGNHTFRVLFRIGFPFHFHNIQEIAFNPNAVSGDEDYGCLFICVGDGGSLAVSPAVPANLGRIDSPLGAIFRIVPIRASATANGFSAADFTQSSNGQFYIPSGTANANPYSNASDPTPGDGYPVVREIYANGFRNPHRITWDTGGSHKMLCGNIGEVQCEEVELVEKGRDYGWPAREGSFRFLPSDPTHVYPLSPSPDTGSTYTYPVAQYDHATGFSIVGGSVYRGAAIPELYGKYLCGDIVNGKLWIADEAAMILSASTATGQAAVPLEELGVKSGTTATSLLSILGASRADLRFGTDHAGELYVLSKWNGTIYKVEQDSDPNYIPPVGSHATWAGSTRDFEDGKLDGISISHSGGAVLIVNDPVEGASNRVLRVQNPGTATTFASSFAVPEIPDDSTATLYFRFFIPDQNHEVSFGLSDSVNPVDYEDFEIQMVSSADTGQLRVLNGLVPQPAATLSPGVWYSAWVQIYNAAGSGTDKWNLSLAKSITDSALLSKTNLSFRNGTASNLRKFFIRSTFTGGGDISPIYLDDIHIDLGHANTTRPGAPDWQVVDQFETDDSLANWDIPDSAQQSTTVLTEANGNRFLRRAASSSPADNLNAIAARRLPFETPPSQTLTTFFRFRIEGGDLNHQLGITSLNPANPVSYTPDDFESHLRLSGDGIDLYDGVGGGQGFISANPIPPLEADIWYKIWLVAKNSGWASGGQKWQAYLQGGIHPQPVPLSQPLFFRNALEGYLSHFLAIATTGADQEFGNDAIHLDDIYASPGMNLSDPVGKSWISTQLSHAESQITLSHGTRSNRFYQFFESDDLQLWTPLAEPVEGDTNIASLQQAIIHPRRFFLAAEHSRRNFHPAAWTADFSQPGELTLVHPDTSQWTASPGKIALTLLAEQAFPVVAGMVPRPGSYALAPGDWRNVDIRLTARTLRTAATPHRDIVIPFGYVDPTHFYYAHFSAVSDGAVHSVIMKVTGSSTRQVIHTPLIVSPAPFTALGDANFRVTHHATGGIAIYSGDLSTPIMTANDTSYPVGRVGFGSFDDPAEFLSFSVSGEQR